MHLRGLLSFSGTSACWELGRPGPSTEKGTNAWLRLSNTGMSSHHMSLRARSTGVEGLPQAGHFKILAPTPGPGSIAYGCVTFSCFLVSKSTLRQHSSPSGTWWWSPALLWKKTVCSISLNNHKIVSLLKEDKKWGRAL